MPTKEEKITEIQRQWLVIQISLADLELNYIKSLKEEDKITNVFILGLTLDNQLEYFKRTQAKEAFPMKELPFITEKSFKEFNTRRKAIYQRFCDEVLSKLKTEKIVEIIKERLEKLEDRYLRHIENLNILDRDGVVEMLGYRDKIKILLDELGYWTNIWDNREETSPQEQVAWREEYLKKIEEHDYELREFIIVEKPEFFRPILQEEAQKHLILKPDGTERFNFWWWYL